VDHILTLDRDIQYAVEVTLSQAISDTGATSGTVIVMQPDTGAILAMASLPDYDPNTPPTTVEEDVRRNPAVSDQYEPGSVFKILTMAIGLDAGAVTPETTYTDQGFIEIGGAYIRNWDGGTYGEQDMTGLLAHSLNVGASLVASWTGPDKFYAGLQRFGIGLPTGVDLANEASGYLRQPGDEDWHEADLATNSFGQGVATTPLQMIAAVSAVANGGVMMTPHVVQETVQDGVHHANPPAPSSHAPGGQVISPQAAEQLKAMMAEAVKREIRRAQVPGYAIAGKTGTAQIARPGGFYDPEKTIASFIGFFPVDEPQVIILVKLDEPTSSEWGSLTAAPTFKTLAERIAVILEIPPDEIREQLAGN
jgi:cell division protein FtsI/penicillin-binding protein 2